MEADRNRMRVLSRAECLAHLGCHGLGRLAVTVGALPAIFPINYAVADGNLYFRTAPGTKLSVASRNSIVAFEVDGVDRFEHAGWSVLAVGPASEVTHPAELDELATLPLRRWIAGGPETLVRIHLELVSGRAITHLAVAGPPHDDGEVWLAACPACGSDALQAVSAGELVNLVCTTCWCCWHTDLGAVYRVPWMQCAGCEITELCRAAHHR